LKSCAGRMKTSRRKGLLLLSVVAYNISSKRAVSCCTLVELEDSLLTYVHTIPRHSTQTVCGSLLLRLVSAKQRSEKVKQKVKLCD